MQSRIIARCIAWRTRLLHATVVTVTVTVVTFIILKTEATNRPLYSKINFLNVKPGYY